MNTRGFTLIELLVSTAIFSIMMVMALGALLSLSVADRKAETLKSAIDNLTFALDSMSRAIRTGSNYDCGNTASIAPNDCKSPGANYFAFLSSDGVTEVAYRLEDAVSDPSGAAASCNQTGSTGKVGCIQRKTSTDGGLSWKPWLPITSPDIYINIPQPGFLFHAVGDPTGDNIQPKVIITVSGKVPVSPTQDTKFFMQTSVAQRIYDQ